MSGASDQADDVVLDETSGVAPGDGEDLTLEGILRSAGVDPREVWPPAPPTVHEVMAQRIRGAASGVSTSGRLILDLDDPLTQVAAWVRDRAGRPLGSAPTWIRLIRTDLGRGALFVLSSPHPGGEAELTVVLDPGMLTRSAIVDVCRWAFFALEVRRIVVRIPVDRADLQDLARRGGFAFEGVARGFFYGEGDASTWAMTLKTCRWLTPKSPAPVPADAAPFSSLKVH